MEIISNPEKVFRKIQGYKLKRKQVGFIPTMGALHEGHLSLIRKARKENDIVVVSIFVNPIQFGQGEDYNAYPRVKNADSAKCKKEKVDMIFYPKARDIYPDGYLTYVEVERLSNCLCGRYREGHFKGVTTVVLKLLNIVHPDTAYFGLKDYQQFIIIRKMVRDLNLNVKIKPMPLIRETDGLAMSSRNKYLDNDQRKEALLLSRSLFSVKKMIQNGEKRAVKLKKEVYRILLSGRLLKKRYIDYISIADPDNLDDLKIIHGHCVILIAVWIGKARLIDNIII
ncbi:MAG: pantoate--beta-alanine ligase [Spirochaetes bacterium]|nr:pantoate--beta-alanine ligase [Spirochaetota bacterium]